MDQIVQGAVAGVVAGLLTTAILGVARWIRQTSSRRRDIRHIRKIVRDARTRVFEAEDFVSHGMNRVVLGDALRAAQYNLMIKQLMVALGPASTNLSLDRQKELRAALDWFHVDSLYAVNSQERSEPQFIAIRDGLWPTTAMPLESAAKIFARLAELRWLNVDPPNAPHEE